MNRDEFLKAMENKVNLVLLTPINGGRAPKQKYLKMTLKDEISFHLLVSFYDD